MAFTRILKVKIIIKKLLRNGNIDSFKYIVCISSISITITVTYFSLTFRDVAVLKYYDYRGLR